MKKILLLSMALLTTGLMANKMKSFNYTNERAQAGGIIDKQIVFVYNENEMSKAKKDSFPEILEFMKNDVCKDKDSKGLIEEGYVLTYIYNSKKDIKVINIDSCK